MRRDNKRHPNGTVPIEPRSSAKPIEEAPVPLQAAIIPVPLLAAVIPVLLAPAAPPVVLLATWDITVLVLLAELLNALARGASEALCSVCLAAALAAISLVVLLATWDITVLLVLAELFHAYAQVARDALGTEVPSSTLFISQPIAGFLIECPERQQGLGLYPLWYFSQPCTAPKKSVGA